MSIVICKLPKSGLGNQLFPLMHAMVFAHINQMPLKIIGYHQFKIGPYLRNEKSKRNYLGYFRFQKSIAGELIDRLICQYFLFKYTINAEPALIKLNKVEKKNIAFIFSILPSYNDYFVHLREHRKLVIDLINSSLSSVIKRKLFQAESSAIGVHIRMGDFKKLIKQEEFLGGHVRTPEEYFVSIINEIRLFVGFEIAISVFTDGYKEEFHLLTNLSNVSFIDSKNDMVDLLSLSKCRLIVTSQGSTYSYWASFISDASVIHHPKHIHSIFGKENNGNYEGYLNMNNPLLLSKLELIKNEYLMKVNS